MTNNKWFAEQVHRLEYTIWICHKSSTITRVKMSTRQLMPTRPNKQMPWQMLYSLLTSGMPLPDPAGSSWSRAAGLAPSMRAPDSLPLPRTPQLWAAEWIWAGQPGSAGPPQDSACSDGERRGSLGRWEARQGVLSKDMHIG